MPGLLFGVLLALTEVPGLAFANPIAPGSPMSNAEFDGIQRVLPVQMVWPATLGIAAVAFLAICALALVLMSRLFPIPLFVRPCG